MRHLLSIRDLSKADLQWILAASEQPHPRPLEGKGVALYFEKPSARTRNSMELAAARANKRPDPGLHRLRRPVPLVQPVPHGSKIFLI